MIFLRFTTIFQSFSQKFQKGRDTIHLSLRCVQIDRGKVLILAQGPWSRFLEQRRLRELDSSDGVLPGGEGEVGEHERLDSYLWVVSVDAEGAGGGPATGAGGRRRRLAATARFWWPIRDGLAPESFTSARRSLRAGRLGQRRTGGGSSSVS